MTDAQSNHERDVAGIWERIGEHYQDAERQVESATQQMSDHTEDYASRSGRIMEDLGDKIERATEQNSDKQLAAQEHLSDALERAAQTNADRQESASEHLGDSLQRYNASFDEAMTRIEQSFERTMRNLEAKHADTMQRLGSRMADISSSLNEKVSSASETASKAAEAATEKHADAVRGIMRSIDKENENFSENTEARTDKLGNNVRDAAEKHIQAMSNYAAQAAAIVEKAVDAVARVNDKLAQQMSALTKRGVQEAEDYADKLQKIADDSLVAQEKNAENLQKVIDLQASRVSSLEDSALAHADRIQSLLEREQMATARDNLRVSQINREESNLDPKDAKGKARLEEEKRRIAEEAELRKQEEAQAEADENKRYEREQQKINEKFAKEQQALEQQNAKEKEASDKKEARDLATAQKEHQRNQEAISDAEAKAHHQAAVEIDRINKQEAFQLAANERQQASENLRYAIALRKLEETYNAETEKANRSHQQRLEDLQYRLDQEDARYARQLEKVKQQEEEKTKKAKEEADKKATAVQKALDRENASYQRHVDEAELRRTQEEAAEDRKIDRQTTQAQKLYDRQIANAQRAEDRTIANAERTAERQIAKADEVADRQISAAQKAADRQQSTLDTHYSRQERDYNEMLEKIESRRDRAVEHENQALRRSQDSYDQHVKHLEEKIDDLSKKLAEQQENIREKTEASQSLAAEEWTQNWVDRANKVEEEFDKLEGKVNGFRWKLPDDSKSAPDQMIEKLKEVQDYLIEFDKRSISDLDTIQKAYFQLRTAGVDPVAMSLDNLQGSAKGTTVSLLGIATTLEALPQGKGQIELIDRALTSLAHGSILNVQRELNKFGIQLDQITTEVDGKVVHILNEHHRLNADAGVTAEQATQAVLLHLSQMTDGIQKNLVGTYAQIVSSFKTMRIVLEREAGESFFGGLKDQLKDLAKYVDEQQENLKDLAKKFGTEIGNIIKSVSEALRHMDDLADDPTYRIKDYVGNILDALGHLKDSVVSVMGDVWKAFFPPSGSGSASDTLAAIGNTIDEMADKLRQSGPDIGKAIKSFWDVLVEFGAWVIAHRDEIVDFAVSLAHGFKDLTTFLFEHREELSKLLVAWMALNAVSSIIGIIEKFGLAIIALVGPTSVLGGIFSVIRLNASFIATAFGNLVTEVGLFGRALLTHLPSVSSFSAGLNLIATFARVTIVPALSQLGAELAILGRHIGAVISSAGPVYAWFVSFISLLGRLIGVVASVAVGIARFIGPLAIGAIAPAIASAVAAVTTFVATLSTPIIVIAAVTAAVVGLALAWANNWGDIRGKTQAVVDWLRDNVPTQVKKFIDDTKKFFEDGAKGWGDAFSSIGTKVKQALDNIGPTIKEKLDGLGTIVKGVVDSIGTQFSNLGTIVRDKLNGLGDVIKTVLTNLRDILRGPIAAIGEDFNLIGQIVQNRLVKPIQDGLSTVGRVFSAAGSVIRIEVDRWGDIFGKIAEVIRHWLGDAYNRIGQVFNDIGTTIHKNLDNWLASFSTTWEAISGQIKQWLGQANSSIITPIMDAISKKLKEAGDTFSSWGTTVRGVLDATGKVFDQTGQLWNFILNQIVTGIQRWASDVVARFGKVFDDIGTNTRRGWDNFSNEVTTKLTVVLDFVKYWAGEFVKGLVQAAKDGVTGFISGLGDFHQKVQDKLKEIAGSGLVSDWGANHLTPTMAEAAKSGNQAFIRELNQLPDQTMAALHEVAGSGKVQDWAGNSFGPGMEHAGKQGLDAFIDELRKLSGDSDSGIGSILADVMKELQSFGKDSQDTIETNLSAAATGGTKAIQGMANDITQAMNGLQSNIKDITASIQAMMQNMVASVNAAAQGAQAAASAAEAAASRAEAAATRAANAAGRAGGGTTSPVAPRQTTPQVGSSTGSTSGGSSGSASMKISSAPIQQPTVSSGGGGGGGGGYSPPPSSGGGGGGTGRSESEQRDRDMFGMDRLISKPGNITGDGIGIFANPNTQQTIALQNQANPNNTNPGGFGGFDTSKGGFTPAGGESAWRGSGTGGGIGASSGGSQQKFDPSSIVTEMSAAIQASPAYSRMLGALGGGAVYIPGSESPVGDADMYAGSGLAAWAKRGSPQQNMSLPTPPPAPPKPNNGPLQDTAALPNSSPTSVNQPAGGGGGGGGGQPEKEEKEGDPAAKPPEHEEKSPTTRDEPDRNVVISNEFGTFIVNGSSPEFIDQFVKHQIELFNASSVSAAT